MSLGPVSFSGLASGLDIKTLIDAILNAERRPVRQLEARQETIGARKSAFEDLGSKLGSLQSLLQQLSTPSTLAARTATSSDTDIIAVTASSTAEIGLHSVEVQNLARAHGVRSETVSDRLDPVVSDGTITVRSGSQDLITVDVSAASGNNTLSAVRDAINAADAGVTASIVNDGVGDLLVVRSSTTGLASALTITDSTNLGLDDAGNLLEDAADATVIVDGVTVTSASNTLTKAIAGATVTLLAEEPGTEVSLTIAADTEAVKAKIREFKDAYNVVAQFLSDQSSADAQTGQAGILAGDSLLRRVQDLLGSAVSAGVSGLPSTGLTTLGSIGVAVEGPSGLLEIDEDRLTAALTDHFDEIARLFSASGRATDAAVSFVSVSSATRAGTYAVEVTTAPEKATVAGSGAIQQQGINQDETLTITFGTANVDVSLEKDDKIDVIVDKINSALVSAGVAVRASDDGGTLRISSVGYGSAVSLTVVSDRADPGNGKSTGIGTTPLTDTGVDIAGKIDGVDATGIGTLLTAAEGTDVEGLVVSVVTDATGVAARGGDFGTITVSRGVAETLVRDLKAISDPIGGLISTTLSRYDEESRRIQDEIDNWEARLREREVQLTIQFDAAERAIQTLQTQQAALGQSFSLF